MCQNGQQTPAELLQNSDVKEAIVTGYSQQYYEKLLETGKIFSDVLYDSIQKNYHLYAWKDKKYDGQNMVRLRYYPLQDSVATNLIVDDLEIDKSGFDNYDWHENPAQKIPFIIKKAEQGYATAQLILGIYYGGVKGINKEPDKQFKWMQKAAEQGLSSAQSNLGQLYSLGKGTEKDEQAAVKWISKAVEQENVAAMETMANCYISGTLVAQDYSKAVDLYKRASYQDTQAQYMLGEIYWQSNLVPSNKQIAMKYFTAAAENGDIDAQLTLGYLYLESESIPNDYVKSLHWFSKIAEQGNAYMQWLLANVYMQDEMPMPTVDEDTKEVLESLKRLSTKNVSTEIMWLTKAAEQGLLNAQRSLAIYYHLHDNFEEAQKWFNKTAEQGDDLHIIYGY